MNTTDLYRIIEQKDREIIRLKNQKKIQNIENKKLTEQLTLTDVVKSFYCHQQSPMKHNRCSNQCEMCARKQ